MTGVVVPAFNEVIHAPLRLRICGMLRRVGRIEFGVVRDTLESSDANLSKNLRVLGDAGFVSVEKEPSLLRADARRLTWVSLTEAGRVALEAHLAALREIASGVDGVR